MKPWYQTCHQAVKLTALCMILYAWWAQSVVAPACRASSNFALWYPVHACITTLQNIVSHSPLHGSWDTLFHSDLIHMGQLCWDSPALSRAINCLWLYSRVPRATCVTLIHGFQDLPLNRHELLLQAVIILDQGRLIVREVVGPWTSTESRSDLSVCFGQSTILLGYLSLKAKVRARIPRTRCAHGDSYGWYIFLHQWIPTTTSKAIRLLLLASCFEEMNSATRCDMWLNETGRHLCLWIPCQCLSDNRDHEWTPSSMRVRELFTNLVDRSGSFLKRNLDAFDLVASGSCGIRHFI